MAWSSYAYATAWNAAAAAFVLFETTFTIPLLTAPLRIPRGGVVSKALSGHETVDGWIDIVLEQLGDPYGISLKVDLDTFVTQVFSSWGGEDAEISLKTLGISGTWVYVNCIAHVPRIGEDFEFNPMKSAYVNNLTLRFTVVNEYTPA